MGSYLLSHLHALGGGIVAYLIPFVFVLSLVVFFHELGHFLIARWCGVRILVFSIGFGPEIIGFHDRHRTRWKIAAIPLGGYVKFFGDENAGSTPDGSRLEGMNPAERAQSFFFQPVLKRAAIVVAGPAANFLLAITIFTAIFMLYGKQTMSARVDSVQADSAAAIAGLFARTASKTVVRVTALVRSVGPGCAEIREGTTNGTSSSEASANRLRRRTRFVRAINFSMKVHNAHCALDARASVRTSIWMRRFTTSEL